MTFSYETHNNINYFVANYTTSDSTDPMMIGMLTNNQIPGFADVSQAQSGDEKSFRYNIDHKISMKELFSQSVNRKCLLSTFHSIISALEISQEYMIDVSNIVLDTEYIFVDPDSFRVALICIPLTDYHNGNEEKSFFKSVMFNTIFDYNEACDHIAKIMNYLNGSNTFNYGEFTALLTELGAVQPTEDKSVGDELDPLSGLDLSSVTKDPLDFDPFDFLGAAPEPSIQPTQAVDPLADFSFSKPESSAPAVESDPFAALDIAIRGSTASDPTNDPMKVADDLLSAALQAPQTVNSQISEIELPVEQAPIAENRKAATADSPLSIADDLLSAALEASSSAKASTPVAEFSLSFSEGTPTEPPIMPASKTEVPQSNTVRSRRSRARKEAQAFLSEIENESPVQAQDSVTPPQNSTNIQGQQDPFASLEDFSVPTKPNKQTDAMKMADAILSNLDLEPKNTKSPAMTKAEELLSDFANPRSRKETPSNHAVAEAHFSDFSFEAAKDPEEQEEDFFADFTTPRTRGKKSDAVKTAESLLSTLEAEPKPSHRKTAKQDSDPLAAFASPIKPAKKTDAMKAADALLSNIDLEPSNTRRSTAMQAADDLLSAVDFTPASTRQASDRTYKKAESDTPDLSHIKKTAAMEEAAAILDSLDFTVPADSPVANDHSYSNSTPSATTQSGDRFNSQPSASDRSAVNREQQRESSSKKGGFLSRFKKKGSDQEASTPISTVPVSVSPIPGAYFDNAGETTVLSAAQNVQYSNTPYLVRASNRENIYLTKPLFRIGKDREFSDYCIVDNSAVSRRHANFMVRNGDVYIVDNNSTNHTYVNGSMIRSNTEVRLAHGDEIRLANEDFVLYYTGMH